MWEGHDEKEIFGVTQEIVLKHRQKSMISEGIDFAVKQAWGLSPEL